MKDAPVYQPNLVTRLFQKVDTKKFDANACWEWRGAEKLNGYGHMSVGGKNTSPHRVSFELFVGKIPEGMDVCHSCDNRSCVNPDHLFVGSRTDNMQDAKAKGRLRGGRHLNESHVREIVTRLNSGQTASLIAKQSGINYGIISSIKRKQTYVKWSSKWGLK